MPSSQAWTLGPAVGASLGFVVDGGWVGAAVDTEVGEVVGEIVGSELVGEAVGLPVGGCTQEWPTVKQSPSEQRWVSAQPHRCPVLGGRSGRQMPCSVESQK